MDLKATQVTRVEALAKGAGIENLIVFLGNNNVLKSVAALDYKESTAEDLNEPNPDRRKATVYTPEHYEALLKNIMHRIEGIDNIDRVFWATVPPVTVPPVSLGVGGRMDSNMGLTSPYGKNDDPEWYRRYFRYYTRPWIPERNFNPNDDPRLFGEQAMKIDRIIAEYKRILKKQVKTHIQKRKKEDWFVIDLHWVLERLASRRYHEDPSVPPPPNWTPYELPNVYEDLKLNTRFLRSHEGHRVQGGLFSLDGIHPTTAGYGIVAQEVINVMQANGVKFFYGDGKTERPTPITVDWKRILRLDSLVHSLPNTLDDLWDKLIDGDQIVDIFKRVFRALTLKG